LRSQGDARWKTIADAWLATPAANTNHVIAGEVRKIKLADARLFNAPAAARQLAAQKVLATNKISSGEWLAATREVVCSNLQQNQVPNLDAKITQGVNKFGAAQKGGLTHGLANACRTAGRADLAATLFQRNVSTLPVGETWGKSQWALAKLQRDQGDHVAAATGFWTFSQQTALPQKLRLTALIEWTKEISATNQPELVVQAKPQIEAALPLLTDYEQVLDLARQVRASKLGRPFAEQIFARGKTLALAAFDACGHPSPAATILYKFARRATSDFRKEDVTLASWARLTDAKRAWLWSVKEDYWYYLELVFRCYRDTRRTTEAEAFIAPLLADSATPAHGYAILADSYANLKRMLGDYPASFALCEKVIQAAPMHEWASEAYYWLALRAWKQGNPTLATTLADKLLQTVGKTSTLYWMQAHQISALLFKAGLDAAQVTPTAEVTAAKIQKQLQTLQADLTKFNA
jgi:tetratricopeptide (TPR) repeat protein